jgi:uncharacterized protein involved in exopolysaccharide biosynthesis
MGQIQSLEELVDFLIRRRWLIAAVTVLGTLVAAWLAATRPDVYESASVIQVEAAQVTDGVAADTGHAARLMQAIEQRLTTRDNLIAMIERHGLFADLPALSLDQKVGLMRGAISFIPVASVGNQTFGAPAAISAIIITARFGTAEQAARVANDLAQGILDLSSSGTNEKARETLAFFQAELARVETDIAAVEGEASAYRTANAGATPALAEAQREQLVTLDTALAALEQEEASLVAERAALEAQGSRRATERRRLEEIGAQLGRLSGQQDTLAARKAEVEARLVGVPEVERTLAGFDRTLQQLQDQYAVVTRRLAEAETALKLAERQQGERFTLLERAITPEYPLGSGGRRLAMVGAVASLVAGIGLAFLIDLMFPVVRSARQMERQLGLRPVIVLPDLSLAAGPRQRGLVAQVRALPRTTLVAAGIALVLFAVIAFA